MMMKNLSLLSCLLFAVAILTMPSCSSDDSGGGIVLGPSVSLLTEAGFISEDADVDPGADFTVKMSVLKGDNPLKALTVYEDGAAIDLNRLSVNGSPAGANPKLITGADVDGLTWEVTVTAHTDAATRTYEFEVQDDANNTDGVSINITTASAPPTLVLSTGSNVINDVTPGTLVSIAITATAGSSNLGTIGVFENDVLMDASRLRYNSADPAAEFSDNPLTFPAEDQLLFDGNIYIRASDMGGANQYSIEVTDESSEVAKLELTINTGTAIDQEFTALLMANSDGPNPDGGLDLDAGMSVSVNSADAEIKDKGIDNSLPNDQNWIQQIEGANGATIRIPDPNSSENFTYESATSKEAIRAAYDTGIDLTSTSQKVAVDDLFIVARGDDRFLLKVTKIEVTDNNNLDFYEFSVKQALN